MQDFIQDTVILGFQIPIDLHIIPKHNTNITKDTERSE